MFGYTTDLTRLIGYSHEQLEMISENHGGAEA